MPERLAPSVDTAGQAADGTPKAPANLTRTVIGNVVLTVVGLICAGLVPFGFNLLVGHGYGAATLGAVSIALGLALFLGQIPGTLSAAATKFMAESLGRHDEQNARAVFQFLLVLTVSFSILLGLAVVLAAPLLESRLHISFQTTLLAALLIPTNTLYLYFKSVYYGIQRVRSYLINETLSDLAFFAVLASVLLLNVTPWLLLPFILNNAIFAAIALRDMRPYLKSFDWRARCHRLEVLKYCVVNGSGTAASLGRWSLGTTIAGVFLTHHAVGLFAAALAITAPLPLLPRAISLVTFAMMARLHGAGEHSSVRSLLQQSTEWLVFVLGLPSGLAIINAAAILSLLFRPDFARGALAAQLIIAGAYITDISRPSIDALSSTRWVRIPTLASFAGLGVSLVIWLALIPRFGISMAGLGFAVGALVTAIIPAYYACKHIGSQPVVFIRPAVMLIGLTILTALGSVSPLLASVLFTIGVLALYSHLLQSLGGYAVKLYRERRARLVQRSA